MLADSALLSLTLDAHRFLLCNGGLVQIAPLQAYVSALLFTPTRSLTRQLFQREEPNWVVAGPVEEHWNSLVKTLTGHDDWVRSVAFSPDGKLVASGSDDNTIKIWDAATGKPKHTLTGHDDWVGSVAFSPDGKLVASGSGDNTIKIWDATTGSCMQTESIGTTTLNLAFAQDEDDRSLQVISDVGAIVVHSMGLVADSVRDTHSSPRHSDGSGYGGENIHGHRSGYGVSPDGCWVTWHGANLLLLPEECRQGRSAVAASGLVIGCNSGRVVVLRFSSDKLPPAGRLHTTE